MWITLAAAASAQIAILQIKIVEGEGAVHVPGARSPRPLTVEVTDETGQPVRGAAVSFHLPEDGPGGTFANGLRTEIVITDSHGRATLHGLQANRTGGRFQIRILASKEQARAGIVSFQYVAQLKPAATPAATHGHTRWLALGAAIAGGAVAGLVAARGSNTPTPVPPPAVTAPAAVPTVGTPTITVGHP